MIKVLKPGLLTSIQDAGRKGFRNLGVPMSGVMDSISANMANALLNNNLDCSLIEITQIGPTLEFLEATTIAISGAEINAKINILPILNNKPYSIKKGDVLSFENSKKGIRCYLAVSGGFQTEKIMKSQSFCKGITSKIRFIKNDLIKFTKNTSNQDSSLGLINNKFSFFETNNIDVYSGPEFNLFTKEEQKILLLTKYSISNINNRMGYRLNEIVLKHDTSMITSPVIPGTVQLTPEGKLIILMKDAQTTGGYPRVFQLSKMSIAILAQKCTGDIIEFKHVKYNN